VGCIASLKDYFGRWDEGFRSCLGSPPSPEGGVKILVVGKGGREHALLRALQESGREVELFCHPGSDAIAEIAEKVEAKGVADLVGWMLGKGIDLCVAGEESYLVKDEGLANVCADAGIPCWGPRKEAAMLEASKAFAKLFMQRHEIPTGKAWVCESIEEARDAIAGKFPTVLKFDGLAAGKGVAVCGDEASADEFLGEVFASRRFGDGKLLVEQFFCLCCGEWFRISDFYSGA